VRLRLLAVVLVALAAVAVAVALRGRDDAIDVPQATVPAVRGVGKPVADPFAYDPDRRAEFERRAAAGTSHPIYAFSPGGAQASAARTARYRAQIERAADAAGVDADRLEGLVLLESAGRPDAIAGGDVDGAVGLAQIVAGTATDLLGMRVDVTESKRLTRRIARETRRGRTDRVRRLERARARIDQRFDPARSLVGMARYLRLARERFGRQDLAFVSYHMGMGNLEGVVRAYAGGEADPGTPIGDVVSDLELTYAQVYFDSTPKRHRAAYARLAALSDDSSNYYWKVLGAREVMRLHREAPDQLARTSALQTAKNSAEEVLHPESGTQVFARPAELERAWAAEEIVPFPDQRARLAVGRDPSMGELAARVGQKPSLYRGLRPEALALAIYVAAQVRAISGAPAPLVVTSTVRDSTYQRQLVRRTIEATRAYSLHTTGYAFDVRRAYATRRQALAFQFVLDRLQTLGVIAWVREPGAIHVTVGREAAPLLPLLDRVG
jgi:soluble lytic murein transglycosylase-like protein